jgi:hypothetical protein
MRNLFLPIAIALVLAAPTTFASAQSLQGYIKTEGAKQGKLNADSTAAPRDVSSGQATGKRMHKPVTIIKEWGAASPNLAKQNKPLTPTVNPPLQRNNLEKGGASSPTRPPYDLKANKGG